VLVIAAILLSVCFHLPAARAQAVSASAWVHNPNHADRLNLRAAPSVLSQSLGKYYNGVEVVVLDASDPAWVYVRIGGTQGWMMRSFLSFGATVPSTIQTVTVNNPKASDWLNLRVVASKEALAVGHYQNGERVDVLGIANEWYHVRVRSDGKTGYMLSQYLTPVGGEYFTPGGAVAIPEDGLCDAVVSTGNTGRLNLRAAPTIASASLGLYYNGVTFRVLENVDDYWSKVRVGEGAGSAVGYMQRSYFTTGSQLGEFPNMMPAFIPSEIEWPLYAQPSADAQIAAVLSNGVPIEVMGVAANGWWHVRYPGELGKPSLTGFIREKYAAILGERVAGIVAPAPSYTLNLREAPNASARILGRYYNGTLVTVLAYEDDTWALVRIGEPGASTISGYMQKSMLAYNPRWEVIDRRPVRTLRAVEGTVPMNFAPTAEAQTQKWYSADGRAFRVLGEYGGWLHVWDTWDANIGFIEARHFK
jgi:uncharacterized protein YgiM (DUF1202 family)